MSLALGKNNANQKQPLHLDGSNHLLVNDSVNKAVLDTIATNTANINVNVGDVEINVADLEALQATTNTTLATIVSHTDGLEGLQTAMSAKLTDIDNSVIASTNVVSKLNLINTTNLASKQLLTDCSAKLSDIDITSAATATILRPYLIEGNGNTANIKSGIDSISACCAGSEVQVDVISSALPSGASTLAKQDALISANHADLVALEASLTSMEAKQDTMIGHNDGVETILTAIDGRVDGLETLQGTANTHLSEIEGAVETLESCVSGTELQVDIVSSALPSGGSTEAKQDTIISHVNGIEDLLTTIDSDTNDIKIAVEILDNAISGNEMQVDIVTSALPSGASTLAKQDTIIGHVNGIEDLLTTIDSDTNDIKTAVELIDDAIKTEDLAHSSGDKGIPCLFVRQDSHTDLAGDGDYMIPTINANGEIRVTSTAASGGSTEAKQDDIIGHVNGIEGLLTTIDADTDAIKTAVEILDNAISGNEMQVDVITLPSLPTGSNTIGTVNLSATDNAVLDAIDTVLDNIKADDMVETVIFNAVINASASGVSSAFERPRNATNWAILIENTSTNNGNHEINLGRSVNNSIYFTSSTDYNTVGERNNVIEFTPTETIGSQKYFKITINNQDASNHTYKVTVCA